MAGPPERFTHNGGWLLPNWQSFETGDYLLSPDGRFKLTITDDGKLVILEDGNVIWTADKNQPYSTVLHPPKPKGAVRLWIAHDATLYHPPGKFMWITQLGPPKDKSRYKNTHMALQNDGNLVIQDMRRLWPKTKYPFEPGKLSPIPVLEGEPLEVGHHYSAGSHYLVFKTDGNMAISTEANELTWQTGTTATDSRAVMQADGNFVIYSSDDTVLWQTGTGGRTDAMPYIQPDGQLMLMNVVPIWARFGFKPDSRYGRKFYPAPYKDIKTGYDFWNFKW